MPNFIAEYENAASHDFCDRVVSKLEELLESKQHISYMEGSETNHGYANRQDYSYGFEFAAPELSEEMHQILSKYIHQYCEEHPSYGMVPCISKHMKVQKTMPKGGFHTWHHEQSYGDHSELRRLTWTLYLNDIPDGEGETEFLEYGIKVKPKKGSLCLFPAAWTHTHRGNPVYTCNKYIATGWYYLA